MVLVKLLDPERGDTEDETSLEDIFLQCGIYMRSLHYLFRTKGVPDKERQIPAVTKRELKSLEMDFSDLFQQSSHLCRFSPDGKNIACCSQHRMVIRDVETLQISSLQTCLDPVQHMEWSPDSKFVMCGMLRRGIVQVRMVLFGSAWWENTRNIK